MTRTILTSMTTRIKYTKKEIQLMTTLGIDQDEESVY